MQKGMTKFPWDMHIHWILILFIYYRIIFISENNFWDEAFIYYRIQKNFIWLNFWDDAWYILFFSFLLLSSSLLWWVETQRFGHCILWPSLGVPCLSEYRNDSTWEIIFKVWLLIKQGVQKLWRSYSNNDVIVLHAYQSEKFPKKGHEMNSKRKIQWHQLFLISKNFILENHNQNNPKEFIWKNWTQLY